MKALVFSVLSALILSACGGSSGGSSASTGPSYDGLVAAAAIDETNIDTIATKTTEALEQAITQKEVNESNPFAPSIPSSISITTLDGTFNQNLIDLAHTVVNSSTNLPGGIVYDSALDLGPNYCGGTATIDDSVFISAQQTGLLNGSMTLRNLCFSIDTVNNFILNGTIVFSQTTTNITIKYSDLTITESGLNHKINMTLSCETAPSISCSVVTDFTGTDNKVYRIADFSISGTDTGPYNFAATFYHPDIGSVVVTTTTPITFGGCTNGHPISGALHFSGSTGSLGTITFTDCDNYIVEWNGIVEPPPAPAPTPVSYSGSWL